MMEPPCDDQLTELQERVEQLEQRLIRCYEGHSLDIVALQLELESKQRVIDTIITRIREFDHVETAAFQAYYKTHPRAAADANHIEQLTNPLPRKDP